MVMPPDPTPCPEQVQQHDATEQQGVKRHQSSSAASIARSIVSLFSAEADELDATELKQYNHYTGKTLQDDHGSDGNDGGLQRGQATPSSCSNGAYGNNTGLTTPEHRDSSSGTRASSSSASSASSAHTLRDAPSRLSIFWRNNISAVVPFKDARDHLALERTYLSYHRTSMVFAMLSVVTAQLTVINHSPTPSPSFGFHILGKPLSIVLACCAVTCSIVGGLRWWRLQNGLLRGVAISGGKEVMIILATTFGLVLAVDIHKEY